MKRRLFWCQFVEGKIELQDIYAGFAENAQRPARCGFVDFDFHGFRWQPSFPGYTRSLEEGILDADMRVETAAAGGNGVAGDQRISGEAVFGAIRRDAFFDGINEFLRSRPEV